MIQLYYDQNNRLKTLTQANGQTLKVLAYDVNGHPTQIQKGTQSPLTIAYTTQGKIKEITNHNRAVRYNYDSEGRLTQLATVLNNEVTETIKMAYDDAGRLNTLSDDKGREIQQIQDSESNPSQTQLMGSNGDVINTITYLYDAQGRLEQTQKQNLDGDTKTNFDYDKQGKVIQISEDDRRVQMSYNGLGQLLGLTQPGEVVTQFNYDHKGQNTALTDARNNKTQSIKDDFGRVVQHISPDTGTNLYTYDKTGNRIKRIDPAGNISTYQWNASNKLIVQETTTVTSTTETTQYEYDNNTGKVAKASNANTTETFDYNPEGQLIAHNREIDGHTFSTKFEYNQSNQRIKKHLPDGKTLRYHYYTQADGKPHLIGKLRAITHETLFGFSQNNIISEIDLDKTDNQAGFIAHNGLQTKYHFRNDGQLQNISINQALNLQYSYDTRGNITGIDTNGTLESFEYQQDRLSFANTLTGNYAYQYDAVGNRTAKIYQDKNGQTSVNHYTYPEETKGNRLTSLTLQEVKNRGSN